MFENNKYWAISSQDSKHIVQCMSKVQRLSLLGVRYRWQANSMNLLNFVFETVKRLKL